MRPSASSSRKRTLDAGKLRRRLRVSLNKGLISIFLVNRIDRALPWPVEFLQQLLGRGDSARNEFLNRPQIACLVVAGPVMLAALRQPLLGKLQCLLGEIEHAPLPDLCLAALPRHLIAQL